MIGTAERVDLFDRRRRSRIRESERTQTAADAVPSPVIEAAAAAARGWIQSFSNHSKGVSGLTDDDDAMSIEKRRNKDNKTVIRPRKRKTRGGEENGGTDARRRIFLGDWLLQASLLFRGVGI